MVVSKLDHFTLLETPSEAVSELLIIGGVADMAMVWMMRNSTGFVAGSALQL